MTRDRNKSPSHLATLEPTARGVRIPIEREIGISDWRVSCVGGGEASKGG